MQVEYDEDKRLSVLDERGLDIADAGKLFDGFHLTRRDEKHSDEEERFTSIGLLNEVVALVIWTPRGDLRRIITMWKANDKEREIYQRQKRDCDGA